MHTYHSACTFAYTPMVTNTYTNICNYTHTHTHTHTYTHTNTYTWRYGQ